MSKIVRINPTVTDNTTNLSESEDNTYVTLKLKQSAIQNAIATLKRGIAETDEMEKVFAAEKSVELPEEPERLYEHMDIFIQDPQESVEKVRLAVADCFLRALNNCRYYEQEDDYMNLLNEIGVLRGLAHAMEAIGINPLNDDFHYYLRMEEKLKDIFVMEYIGE